AVNAAAKIDPGVLEKKTRSEVGPGQQHRNHRKRMVRLLLPHLPVEREMHLALLPTAKVPPDEDRHCPHIAQSFLQCLRPGETGHKLVTVEEGGDAARFQ